MTTINPTPARELAERHWLVWSNEHGAFWAPDRCGYTQRIEKAGRYPKAEAEAICNGANYRANSDLRSGTPPEIMMPAPETLDAAATLLLTQAEEIERLKAGLDDLLPGKLCGESWGLPDDEKVSVVVTFGSIRRARSLITGGKEQ